MSGQDPKPLRISTALLIIVALAAGIAGGYWWRGSPNCNAAIDQRIGEIYAYYQGQQWSEALHAWQELGETSGLCSRQREEIARNIGWLDSIVGPPAEDCDPQIDQQIADALEHHKAQQWPEAVSAWEALQQADQLCPRQQREVEENLKIARKSFEASPPAGIWKRPAGDTAGVPEEPVPEKHFLAYYPQGRRVYSVAEFNIAGTGTNKSWFIQGTGHFAYQYKVVARTHVSNNNGTVAVFEIEFPQVLELQAVSATDSLALAFPEDTLLGDLAAIIDERLSDTGPTYRWTRRLAELVNWADPGLERTLTQFANSLKLNRGPIGSHDDVQFAALLHELSGQRLEVEYVRDLGIIQIKVLDGKQLPPQTLARLAHSSSLLMDYYLFPAAEKEVGDTWTVKAQDVAGLVGAAYGAEATGELVVKREKDREEGDQKLAVLKLLDAEEIHLTFDDGGSATRVSLEPRESEILFSGPDKLIRAAQVDWDARLHEIGKWHMLFGTENIRDVSVTSVFRAQPAEKPAAAPDEGG